MYSLIEEFIAELESGKYLAVLPISRLVLEDRFSLGKFVFYPEGAVNLSEVRIVPNKTIESLNTGIGIIIAEGPDLREIKSSITGISIDTFKENAIVAFAVDLDWESFLLGTHESELSLIYTLSQEVEKAMDLMKFYFCRIELPDSLPGQVGTWNGSNGFSGALLYTLLDNESYIIAGSVVTHYIAKGVGLELDQGQIKAIGGHPLLESNFGEVGNIAKMGLSLHSGVLESNNETTKFIRAMSLLEFLAFPDEYKKFELVKKEISCHVAKNPTDYQRLNDRFWELTGKKDDSTGQIIGYRTQVIHMGKTLEEIVPNKQDRVKLLKELQRYIGVVLEDMIKNWEKSWDEFVDYRKQLKIKLGLKV